MFDAFYETKNPIFGDWIETQPDFWDLDQATVDAIKNHFKYRECCAPSDKMATFFWRDINKYRQQYKDMLRLEISNATIDPMVNRYFEALFNGENIERMTGSVNELNRGNITNITRNDKLTLSEENRLGISDGNKNNILNGVETDKGTETNNVNERNTNQYGALSVVEKGNIKGTYGKDITDEEVTDNVTDGLKKGTIEKNNKIKENDTNSGSDKTNHVIDTEQTTTKQGKFTVKDQTLMSGKQKDASKAAPMAAVNVSHSSNSIGADTRAYDTVRSGQISGLDFEYASSYAEGATESGTSTTHEEYYGNDGQTTKIEIDGKKTNNYDETIYGKQTELDRDENGTEKQDITDKTTLKGKKTDKRNEKGTDDKTTDMNTTTAAHRDDLNKIGSNQKLLDTSKSLHNDETETSHNTDTENIKGKVTEAANGQSSRVADGAIDRVTGRNVNSQTNNKNQYVGREGLTPQEGLQSAINYLQKFSNSVTWLCGVLEHNFISVFEL